MNKKDISIVALLVLALFGWMWFQAHMAPPRPPATPPSAVSSTNAPAISATNAAVAAVGAPAETPAVAEAPAAAAPEQPAEAHAAPEQTLVLSNAEQRVTLSSWGGAIRAVDLLRFPSTRSSDSEPVRLDFDGRPSLAISGIPGLSTNSDFTIEKASTGTAAVISRNLADGLRFERTIRLEGNYRLAVTDAYINEGGENRKLPRHAMLLGPISNVAAQVAQGGYTYLGVDSLPGAAGSKVTFWGKKVIPGLFGPSGSFLGCRRAPSRQMPPDAVHRVDAPSVWVAAKNKFFVQSLAPTGGVSGFEIKVTRDLASSNAFLLGTVSADLFFPEREIKAGERAERHMSYYVGPKKLELLKGLGLQQGDIMEFGSWGWYKWLCHTLLWILNAIYRVLPNYGIAIILLTGLVRLIFWPVMHRSNESMKRMQQLQPELTALREKYKGDPRKLQEKTMELYREHKVNPMASCLPLLVQMPIFFALFTVLRSAVELRYAGFLWIRDLSEPENLLAGLMPFSLSLNLLPLIMTGMTVWQQKLTPSSDPQQQRMMMFMSVFMLFLFYNMASGLTLYWTVSQFLAIVQLLTQRKKTHFPAPGTAPGVKRK